MKRIIFEKATSKHNILNEKLHFEPTKCHLCQSIHNGKCQNIISSFCVPENVRTVIKRESDGPDPFKKLRTVEKVLFIEKKVNKLESQFSLKEKTP